MKHTLQRALRAKQVQREKSTSKSVAEKLRLVEGMRLRNAPLKALRSAVGRLKPPATSGR